MKLRHLFTLFVIFTASSFCQIVFKELPKYQLVTSDSSFFDITSTRKVVSLNGKWSVYAANDKKQVKSAVLVPSAFVGENDLVFEKTFQTNKNTLNTNSLKLHFLGLNYSADISVNNVIIHRHSGGEFPFTIDLPKDILKSDKNNVLRVKLYYKSDAENTIPVKQKFLYPTNYGGIVKDVYIQYIPKLSVPDWNISYTTNTQGSSAKIKIDAKIDNQGYRTEDNSYSYQIRVLTPQRSTAASGGGSFTLAPNKDRAVEQTIDIQNPQLWSFDNPGLYTVYFEIYKGENLIDRSRKTLAIYSLKVNKEEITFNGSKFQLNGVTFMPSYKGQGSLATYQQMEKDIRLIKETGFNSVRFLNSVPHPYYLRLCEKEGLLAFVELPLNSTPTGFTEDENFVERSTVYLNNFLKGYKNYSSIAGIGLGSSYLGDNEYHGLFIKNLNDIIKSNTRFLTYASFVSTAITEIENLDLYGIELFNTAIVDAEKNLQDLYTAIGKGKVFISSATYVVTAGNSNGYSNPYTFEAQAKYFEDLLDYTEKNSTSGYFINSMFDYRGSFPSIVAGYSDNNIYTIGLAEENRSTNRLAYKVVSARLHNAEKVTIPIGSKKDAAPMIFIISGIALAILMGVLVNSGRKFREDSSRALLRPYNFFADVRDQRIMSSFHTAILVLIISAVSALLISNLLYYFKESLMLEKLVLSFGSENLMKMVSYLAWHPVNAMIILTIASLAALAIISIFVKIGSLFIRNRVFFSGIFYTVVWSFLPLVLLIPVGIILYRVLEADVTNIYIFIGLLIFTFWIFYRLMKGIYVIYDVNAGSVYFYSLLLIFFLLGGYLFYYQLNSSVFDHLKLVFNQYNLFG